MKRPWYYSPIFGFYLLAGVLYVLIIERYFGIFELAFWLRVFFWLPLIVYHSVIGMISVALALIIFAIVAYYISPAFRATVERARRKIA